MPHILFSTALGLCGLAWEGEVLTGFQLPEGTPELTEQQLRKKARSGDAQAAAPVWIQAMIGRIQSHLAGRMQDFAGTPLAWDRVSEFQRGVYRHTQAIRPGETRSYGDIARSLGLGPETARAVGVALGANPWPLVVPCHRVVAANGKMTGFSAPGGIRTKTRLLALEGAELISE